MRNISSDPVKSSIYNPKEFRGSRRRAAASHAQNRRHAFWIAISLALSLGVAGLFSWGPVQGKAMSLPVSGDLHRFRAGESLAPFSINARGANAHFLVKLEDWRTAAPVVTVFVRQGDEVSTKVPLGIYRLRYASGDRWMGEDRLFGWGTKKAQATDPLVFQLEGNQYRGHVLDLANRPTGNLHTIPDRN